MKNILLLSALIIFIASCEKDSAILKDDVTVEKNLKSISIDEKTFVFNNSINTPICNYNYGTVPETKDIEMLLSSPLAYDAVFKFKLEKSTTSSWAEIINPWHFVSVKSGTKKIILNASCELPAYIDCGSTTQVLSKTFRITFLEAYYINNATELQVTPSSSSSNSFITTAYKYCLGGGWIPDGFN